MNFDLYNCPPIVISHVQQQKSHGNWTGFYVNMLVKLLSNLKRKKGLFTRFYFTLVDEFNQTFKFISSHVFMRKVNQEATSLLFHLFTVE